MGSPVKAELSLFLGSSASLHEARSGEPQWGGGNRSSKEEISQPKLHSDLPSFFASQNTTSAAAGDVWAEYSADHGI